MARLALPRANRAPFNPDAERSRPFYIPQLDGLRFFAFLSVFLRHTPNPHGRPALTVLTNSLGFGLSLFFFLSSYLITKLLYLEESKSGTIALQAFYVRRVLRIWPLYFLFIGGAALAGLWLPMTHIALPRLTAMLLLSTNWYFMAAGMGAFAVQPLWSIAVEEQFYLLWPWLFRALSRSAFLTLAGGVGAASLALTLLLAGLHIPNYLIWLNTGSEAVFFAGGALCALLTAGAPQPGIARFSLWALAGVSLYLLAEAIASVDGYSAPRTPLALPLGYLLAALGCFCVLRAALYFPPAHLPPRLVYLEKISYGLYVFHGFFINAVPFWFGRWLRAVPGTSILAELALTMAAAHLSYTYLEKPFLRLKGRFEVVRTRTA